MPEAWQCKKSIQPSKIQLVIMSSDLGMSSQELLRAQAHLWNDMFGFMRSFSLKSAIELGIPDAIYNHGKPIPVADLASAVSIPPSRVESLRRLMSLLVHNGYFERTLVPRTDEEVYTLTPNSKILVRGHGESITPLVELVTCQQLVELWQSMPAWLKSERPSTVFEMCHGAYLWPASAKMPELRKLMSAAMDSDSAAVAKVIIEDCADQFEGVKSVVEVAGNTGKIARAVAKAFPHIKCAMLELPHVIDATEKSDSIEYVAGDMFERIPPADMLILKWVLMTWSDEECVKILKRCKEAIPTKEKGGKAIIIDEVIDAGADGVHPRQTETQIFFDLQLMIHATGQQRTEDKWKKLFTEAGFKEYKIVPALGMRCIIELYH